MAGRPDRRAEAAGDADHERPGPQLAPQFSRHHVRAAEPVLDGDHDAALAHHPTRRRSGAGNVGGLGSDRSEEHTSELQSLMRTSYAVFCLKKKTTIHKKNI